MLFVRVLIFSEVDRLFMLMLVMDLFVREVREIVEICLLVEIWIVDIVGLG